MAVFIHKADEYERWVSNGKPGLGDTTIDVEVSESKAGLRPIDEFKTKKALEDYGIGLGIDLNKSKTIANMYADLVEFVDNK